MNIRINHPVRVRCGSLDTRDNPPTKIPVHEWHKMNANIPNQRHKAILKRWLINSRPLVQTSLDSAKRQTLRHWNV
jgi:hypothetical protein